MQTSDLLTIKELSEALKVPTSTLYQHTCSNMIPFYKIGRSLRFCLKDVLKYYSNKDCDIQDDNADFSLNESSSLKTEYQQKDHLEDPFQ